MIMNDLDEAFKSWVMHTKNKRSANRIKTIGFVVQRMIFDGFYKDDRKMEMQMFGTDSTKKLEVIN